MAVSGGFDFHTLPPNTEIHLELIILDNAEMSPEQEIVQDLMTIIHCFSSRLYGLRNYRKSLKEALNNDLPQSIQS